MLSVALIWAGNNVFTKAILNTRIEPLPYVFCRFAMVAALMFGWFYLRRIEIRVRRADFGLFLVAGITGYAAYNLLFVIGLSHTSAFAAAILVSLGPIFTLVFSAILRIERVRLVQWLGVAFSFAGVALFVGEKVTAGRPAYGDLLNLIGAASFAVYSLATRPLIMRYGSPVVTAWSVLIGLVAVTPVTLTAMIHQDWGGVGVLGWTGMIYAGVFSMLVGYTIWGWAIRRQGVGRTAPFLFLIPIVTGVLSALILDESLTAFKLIGAALVLVGVALARRTHVVVPVAAELAPISATAITVSASENQLDCQPVKTSLTR
jgi:drug/metabolite transporter (DMT)-like permease